MGTRAKLGEVTLPSGTLVLLDMGLLGGWSHESPPTAEPDGGLSETQFVDLEISGPDAARAAHLVAKQEAEREASEEMEASAFDDDGDDDIALYDIPTGAVESVKMAFMALAKANRLDAHVEVARGRVPHAERVRRALAAGLGWGEVSFSIGNVVAVTVPEGAVCDVVGERCDEDEECWKSVSVVLGAGEPVRREPSGAVVVEQARLLFGDLRTLGAWRHDESLDGKVDLVFWGRDAEKIAREVNAPALEDGNFGWKNLVEADLDEGLLETLREAMERRRLMADLRPHSHHHRVLEQVWSSPTESGTLELDGAKVCGFMTSWGDGAFAVFRELDASGKVVRVTVDFEGHALDDEDDDEDEDLDDEDEERP